MLAAHADPYNSLKAVLLGFFPHGAALFSGSVMNAAENNLQPGFRGIRDSLWDGAGGVWSPQHDLQYTFCILLRSGHGGEGGADHRAGHLGVKGQHRARNLHAPCCTDWLADYSVRKLRVYMGFECLLHPRHRPLRRTEQVPHLAVFAPRFPNKLPAGSKRRDVGQNRPKGIHLVRALQANLAPDQLFSSHRDPFFCKRDR